MLSDMRESWPWEYYLKVTWIYTAMLKKQTPTQNNPQKISAIATNSFTFLTEDSIYRRYKPRSGNVTTIEGWRGGSVKSTFYFWRGSRFNFQNLQPFVTPFPRDLIPSSDLSWHQVCTYLCKGKTFIHIQQRNGEKHPQNNDKKFITYIFWQAIAYKNDHPE